MRVLLELTTLSFLGLRDRVLQPGAKRTHQYDGLSYQVCENMETMTRLGLHQLYIHL